MIKHALNQFNRLEEFTGGNYEKEKNILPDHNGGT